MKLKGRTILVLCLLVFGGYALYDFQKDKKSEEKAMAEARVMKLDFEKVDFIEIQKGEQRMTLERSAEGWNITSPIQDRADNTVAEDFVKNTFPERIIDVAKDTDGIDWGIYGLDKPLGVITFKTAAGEQTSFEISEKRNFEENVFARRDKESRVLVLNSVWQTRVRKTVMDFRDRHFLRHRIASVDVIKLKNSKGLLHIERKDGQWASPEKKDLKLDQNKVRELLTTIAEAQAADISEGDKLPAGAKSLFTLDLVMDGKKWNAEVVQSKDLAIFAKISDPRFVLKMDAGALDKMISMSLEDLKEQPAQPADPGAQAQKDKK